jgi:hypothetical protein
VALPFAGGSTAVPPLAADVVVAPEPGTTGKIAGLTGETAGETLDEPVEEAVGAADSAGLADVEAGSADGGISEEVCAMACEFIVANAPIITSVRAPTRNAVIDLHPYRVAGIRIFAVSAEKQQTLDMTQEKKYESISVGSCALLY